MAQNYYYPWTHSPVFPPCYGIFGHTGQLGSVVRSPEQVTYAHYNQGDGKQLEVESEKPQSEKVVIESEKPNISPPYEPKIPFPQGFDESKLDEQFRKLIEIIQDKLPSRLKDPMSFSKPSVIGSEIIERAMCDLGENVSLMPLSLFERLGIG
ncbi:hypothetical protein MTR_0230s0030 [Medicago truncatula]|uniref:Uncharacterized protein n=1 Tax=Medicago truncatula TaxID=3880 RepID=A0A072TGL2_MEDTR|nr:hypothetical protein MTR_0230s0030 [Medicago truncatula]